MGIIKIKVSGLPVATSLEGLAVLGVDGKNKSVQAPMPLLKGNAGDDAFTVWQKQPGNEEKTYDDFTAFLKQPATEAADRANELSDNLPKIVDGVWWRYNEKTKEYENTGEKARGDVTFATFNINTETGDLEVTYPDLYEGPEFSTDDDGNLLITIN